MPACAVFWPEAFLRVFQDAVLLSDPLQSDGYDELVYLVLRVGHADGPPVPKFVSWFLLLQQADNSSCPLLWEVSALQAQVDVVQERLEGCVRGMLVEFGYHEIFPWGFVVAELAYDLTHLFHVHAVAELQRSVGWHLPVRLEQLCALPGRVRVDSDAFSWFNHPPTVHA